MSYNTLITIIKGGAGSGNFGHAGRPGKRGGSATNVMATLQLVQELMRSGMNKPGEVAQSTDVVYGSNDVRAAVNDVKSVLANYGTVQENKWLSNAHVSLTDSSSFAMLGVNVRPDASIELAQIYAHENMRGKGPAGPSSQLYISLGKLAEKYGDGKLHVYSPGEYTKQKRFWDQVPNAVME